MIRHVALPVTRAEVAAWRVGDVAFISGLVVTARDLAHRRLLDEAARGTKLPIDPTGLPIIHCGPLVKKDRGQWVAVGFGPTSSARMESITPKMLSRFDIPFVVGKGGMGEATRSALVARGSAYLSAVGGTGAIGARAVRDVVAVAWLEELGMPDAVWLLRLSEYGPLLVTMDAAGKSLHDDIARAADGVLPTPRSEGRWAR